MYIVPITGKIYTQKAHLIYMLIPEFSQVLDQVGEKLGREALDDLHLHVSGINYGEKGERNHLNLADSDFQYIELIQALKDHEAKGIVICESPNLEEDALMLQGVYRTSG